MRLVWHLMCQGMSLGGQLDIPTHALALLDHMLQDHCCMNRWVRDEAAL